MRKRSRELRQKMTLPEKILWQFLRASTFAGLHFRRQHPIGYYIVDFCCLQKKLIIELDGAYHGKIRQQDENRDDFLRKHGFRVLRFTNDHVFDHLEWLLQAVADELAIEGRKHYRDCLGRIKYPKKLCALLASVDKYRARTGSKFDGDKFDSVPDVLE
jgi:very-short-patch-repair endonuclease